MEGDEESFDGTDPELRSAVLVDTESGKEFLKATTPSWPGELKRRENLAPIVVGVAVAVDTAIGLVSFAAQDRARFLAGAISGVIAAIVAVILIASSVAAGKLVWE